MTFEAAYIKIETLSPNAEELSPAPSHSGGVDDDTVKVKRETIFLPESIGVKEEEESPQAEEPDSNGWEHSASAAGDCGWSPHTSPEGCAPEPRHRDDFDAFGRSVAARLRQLASSDDTQRIIAEKLIADVIFHGQMQALTPDTRITVPRRRAGDKPALTKMMPRK